MLCEDQNTSPHGAVAGTDRLEGPPYTKRRSIGRCGKNRICNVFWGPHWPFPRSRPPQLQWTRPSHRPSGCGGACSLFDPRRRWRSGRTRGPETRVWPACGQSEDSTKKCEKPWSCVRAPTLNGNEWSYPTQLLRKSGRLRSPCAPSLPFHAALELASLTRLAVLAYRARPCRRGAPGPRQDAGMSR